MRWRPVIGYESVYEVSDKGDVVRIQTGNRLKPSIAKNGYYIVALWNKNKGKSQYIHRIIAETFISNPGNFNTVNHKDGNKLNNDISNLEWCSYGRNNQHAYDTGLKTASQNVVESARKRAIKRNKGLNHPRNRSVTAFDLNGNHIADFKSVIEASSALGINRHTVLRGLTNKVSNPKKYVFKYKEAE